MTPSIDVPDSSTLLMYPLDWESEFGCVKRLQRVNCVHGLSIHIPFKELEVDPIRQEVRDRETVLLDRLDFFLYVEMRRRRRTNATKC